MANKQLFKSSRGRYVPPADARNEAGGPAYALTPRQALAQYAATGCLGATFYASAEDQLDRVLQYCSQVEPTFIARTALYARERGYMKDMPALLCAVLSVKDGELLERVFSRVLDNGRMLRNFVQMLRSGTVGRKSLGSRPKRLVLQWLAGRGLDQLLRDSLGNDPSLADILKMVHPKPDSPEREALYGYLLGREVQENLLPETVRALEAFKKDSTGPVPDVPFQFLTSLDLGRREWTEIARKAGWQMTRMNLNTFARHGVFEDEAMVELVAARLRDPAAIAKARVFPYQLLAAYKQTRAEAPMAVREALQDALEYATLAVPILPGKVFVFPDVSGSMHSPVTGSRGGGTSAVTCVEAAALIAAAIVRRNPAARVIPFDQQVIDLALNPRDSIMTNAASLARIGGGGTSCSAPLVLLNAQGLAADLIVYVSDTESWVDASRGLGTATLHQWELLKLRCPGARMACINLQPYGTVQAGDREDILNVGGFSDQVFEILAEFAAGNLNPDHWVGRIESVEL